MRPIIVTGAAGMLGQADLAQGWRMSMPMVGITKEMCDITNVSQVRALVADYVDPIIINCAGIVRGRGTKDMENVNGRGPHILAQNTTRLIQVSTDCVFSGKIEDGYAYDEVCMPDFLDEYGRTKRMGEVHKDANHVTVRGSFIGFGQRGLLHWLTSRPAGSTISGYTNWDWNGVTASAFARWLLAIATSPTTGLIHLVGPEELTKYDLLAELVVALNLGVTVEPKEHGTRQRMILASRRLPSVPDTWDEMLAELAEEYRPTS